MNQGNGQRISLFFHDQQKHTDVKQHTADIIEKRDAIMQNSHKQCIAEMQKDCQTYQIAVNIIAVIIFIKFHWHTVNLLSFHSCREASFYTALHRFVNSRKNSAVYGILLRQTPLWSLFA